MNAVSELPVAAAEHKFFALPLQKVLRAVEERIERLEIHALAFEVFACGNGDVHPRFRLLHVLRAEVGAQYRAAETEGKGVLPVGEALHGHGHRDAEGERFPRLYGNKDMPVDLKSGQLFVAYGKLHFAVRPVGDAKREECLPFSARFDRAAVRKREVAGEFDRSLPRLDDAGEILFEIDAPPVRVGDAVPELGKVLHAAPRAAPEFVERAGEDLEISARHGLEVGRHARFGVLRGQNGVHKGVVVIVGIIFLARHRKEPARQL